MHLKLVHAKTKPYCCDLCSFATANRYTLKNHRKKVHKRILAHSCPYDGCTSSFGTEWDLLRHIDGVHFPEPDTTVEINQTRQVSVKANDNPQPKVKKVRKVVKKRPFPGKPPSLTIHIY
jgi:hypothetical protein